MLSHQSRLVFTGNTTPLAWLCNTVGNTIHRVSNALVARYAGAVGEARRALWRCSVVTAFDSFGAIGTIESRGRRRHKYAVAAVNSTY